jgi:alanyl-tRNA synthetase
MTERIYYTDPYTMRFTAAVSGRDADGHRIRLDRTAFYPTSGGQPHDLGTLAGIAVTDVVEQGEEVVHVLAEPLPSEAGLPVDGCVEWNRRFDHMQQHTGQHLLSAVMAGLFGFETVSFHLGSEVSTIELATPTLAQSCLETAERRVNEIIAQGLTVTVTFEDAASVEGLRKVSERTGILRVVSIGDIDRSACGGTHVRHTGEIGCVLLRGTEKLRRNTRLEFACGLRAVRQSRQEYRILTKIAETISCSIQDSAKVVAAQLERLAEAEKNRRRIELEAASMRGRERFAATEPRPSGLRFHETEAADLDDGLRAEAQAFTANSRAAFLVWSVRPPSVLLAVSRDSGVQASDVLRPLLSERGGRGGGSDRIAQGSVPSADLLSEIVDAVRALLRDV